VFLFDVPLYFFHLDHDEGVVLLFIQVFHLVLQFGEAFFLFRHHDGLILETFSLISFLFALKSLQLEF
jgi:hypothetical protein